MSSIIIAIDISVILSLSTLFLFRSLFRCYIRHQHVETLAEQLLGFPGLDLSAYSKSRLLLFFWNIFFCRLWGLFFVLMLLLFVLFVFFIKLFPFFFCLFVWHILELRWYLFSLHLIHIFLKPSIFLLIIKKFLYLFNLLLIGNKLVGKAVLAWDKFAWQLDFTKHITSLVCVKLRSMQLLGLRLADLLKASHSGIRIVVLRCLLNFLVFSKLFKPNRWTIYVL